MESLLLPYINNNIQLAEHQHGFRKNRSTTTALHLIQNQVRTGLNQKKLCARTILVALDLSKAFDTVTLAPLLEVIRLTSIPNNIKRWLCTYLRGRQTFVEFMNATSSHR